MEKLLMYGDVADHDGWNEYHQLADNDINEIRNTANDNTQRGSTIPRVPIPSPFARFELVEKAFKNVATKIKETGSSDKAEKRDQILVSHTLDAIQLFYENNQFIKIEEWSKNESIENLRNGNKYHKQVADTLDLYMRNEDSGFSGEDLKLYMMTYDSEPIAITSPSTVFIPTPQFPSFQNKEELRIDGDINLFASLRPNLYETGNSKKARDPEFVKFLFVLKRYIHVNRDTRKDKQHYDSFFDYLEVQKEKFISGDLRKEINEIDRTDVDDLLSQYNKSDDVYIFGNIQLFCRNNEEQSNQVAESSDFVIDSKRSEEKPLVLSNNCKIPNMAYTNKATKWDAKKYTIDYSQSERNVLPGTTVEYPWLCENDFLSECIIELPYNLNPTKGYKNFFDGNVTGNSEDQSFLLPLKKKFFEYFDLSYLKGQDGKDPNFKIEVNKDKTVTVSLRVPVKGGRRVILRKEYSYPETSGAQGFNTQLCGESDVAIGSIVKVPTAISIFPFIQLQNSKKNIYAVQLMRHGWGEFLADIEAYVDDDKMTQVTQPKEKGKVSERESKSKYYRFENNFDYLFLNVNCEVNDKIKTLNTAVIIPELKPVKTNSSKLHFGIDFGTSNSHIAVRNDNGDFKEIGFNGGWSTFDETQKARGIWKQQFTNFLRQEFLPGKGLGVDFKFPTATVLAIPNVGNVTTPLALRDACISFIYGKEDLGDANSPKENLKWSKDNTNLSKAYMEELILLARNYALENGVDPNNCSLTWTYPLSMGIKEIENMEEVWEKLFCDYFGNDNVEERLTKCAESIAPILYYRDRGDAWNNFNVSIDIGGGTCDVVFYLNKDNQNVTSFRFGADSIFGNGRAADVDFIGEAIKNFSKVITNAAKGSSDDKKGDMSKVKDLLNRISGDKNKNTSEATRILFGLSSHPSLIDVAQEDKDFNMWLGKEDKYKIIFLYYYAAIIYYITEIICHHNFGQPQAIFFSGSGSKLLSIIGKEKTLGRLTSKLIETFSNGKYSYDRTIKLVIEKDEPKQLTAKGVLVQEENVKKTMTDLLSKIEEKKNLIKFSLEGRDSETKFTYGDLLDKKEEIIKSVEKFNRMFCEFISENIDDIAPDSDEFKKTLDNFRREFVGDNNKYLTKTLVGAYDTILAEREPNADEENRRNKEFNDAPFFYPIIMILKLLMKKNDNE